MGPSFKSRLEGSLNTCQTESTNPDQVPSLRGPSRTPSLLISGEFTSLCQLLHSLDLKSFDTKSGLEGHHRVNRLSSTAHEDRSDFEGCFKSSCKFESESKKQFLIQVRASRDRSWSSFQTLVNFHSIFIHSHDFSDDF